LAGASTAIVYYYQDDIEQIVIAEVNKILIQPLEVEDIEISAINNFPYTSIEFNNIKAIDSFGKDTLFKAEKMSLKFNALDLYNQKYDIQEIVLTNGYSSIYYLNGKPNYEIWNIEEDTSSAESDLNFNLNNIQLENFEIQFKDESQSFHTKIINNNTSLKIGLEKGVTLIALQADLTNKKLIVDDLSLMENKELKLNSNIEIDSAGQLVSLLFESDELVFNSNIVNHTEGINVSLDSEKLDIEKVRKIIPEQYATYIDDYNIKGNTDVKLSYSQKNNQEAIINLDFIATNFHAQKDGIELENASFSGAYASQQNRVEIIDLKGLLNKDEIKVDVELINFDDPKIKLALKTNIDLSELAK
jgi:hypothetical protein